ncbi:MAG: hypothetical protein ABSF24_06695 [Candidatus Bathyarchaeia archaeon]
MLNVGKCRSCGFVVHHLSTPDFKALMNGHLSRSHPSEAFDFPLHVTMTDFKALFIIVRVTKEEEIEGTLRVLQNRGYWVAIRNHPQLQNILVSGLGIGELKPF